MNAVAEDRPDPILAPRLRTMQYVSDASILFAAAVLALVAGTGWAWGPFVVGPAVVAAAALCNAVTFRMGLRAVGANDDVRRKAIARRNRRNVVIVPGYLTFGLAAGVISGALESYWPDVVLAVIVVLTAIVAPLALLPTLKRRAAATRVSAPGQ